MITQAYEFFASTYLEDAAMGFIIPGMQRSGTDQLR